jgi:hypothetical protein
MRSKGIQYLGIDFSASLIDTARRAQPGAKFETISYDDLVQGRWKAPHAFDVVVFNFSLFEEDLRPILRRASTFLSPTGAILIQTLHPSLLNPYQDGWRTEDFKSFPVPFVGTMRWYGRTQDSWLRLLSECGLKVIETIEPLDPVSKAPLSVLFVLSL